MAGKFQPGDVVMVRSGGPSMTVDFWDDERELYVCTWFEKTKRQQSEFQETTLEKVPPRQGPTLRNP